MYAVAIALTTLLVIGANAQSSTSSSAASTQTFDSCVQNCLNQALSQTGSPCPSYTDWSCSCPDSGLENNAHDCISSSCSDAELISFTAVQAAQCAGNSINSAFSKVFGSGSSTSSSSSTSSTSGSSSSGSSSSGFSSQSSSSTSSSSSSSSTSGSGNSSGAMSLRFGATGAFLVAAAGIVGGAMLVL